MLDNLTVLFLSSLAGILVGFSKTGVPGAGILIVPIMASIFPAKQSVGVLLPMLVCADLLAVWYYKRHANKTELLRLLPGCLVGMFIGFRLLAQVNSENLKPVLGILVLTLLVLEWLRYRLDFHWIAKHSLSPVIFGTLAGFATTIGNAAGPIISIFLVSRGFSKHKFIGTAAWFFLIVNIAKLPLFYKLNLITHQTLVFDLFMLPSIGIGIFAGIKLLPKIPQNFFNQFVYVISGLAAFQLLGIL
ncbi:sulfite exporter TauE/SafE family protein [Dapis sp. BLCC M229]|uniref:sulfite exporter TauE/SafE family protein n=1 Tax=Dapis sp. BLCC M229 TaxID=3400188 RepID=UPI003CE80F90